MLRRLFISASLCLFLFGSVKADPIVITSGGLSVFQPVTLIGPFSVSFQGPDLSISAGGDAMGNNIPICSPCTDAGSLRAVASGSGLFGNALYQGIRYPFTITGAPGTAEGYLEFLAPNYVVPIELQDAATVRITAPFELFGLIQIVNGPGLENTVLQLTGAGTVTLDLARFTFSDGTSHIRTIGLNYSIGTPPSGVTIQAVPEPTSMLLLTAGIVGFCVRVKITGKLIT